MIPSFASKQEGFGELSKEPNRMTGGSDKMAIKTSDQPNASSSTTSPLTSSPTVKSKANPSEQFTIERVKQMFCCLGEGSEQLCALYLNGNSSDLFEDHPMSNSPNSSGTSSPLDVSPAISPKGKTKRSSVKRRKNCKLNNKVDGNRNRAENESEESTHFFPTAGPSSTEEKDGPETSSPNKQSKSSEHSQFDGTLATLSGHLLAVQEEVEKVVFLSSASSSTELEKNGRKVQLQSNNNNKNSQHKDGQKEASASVNTFLSEPILSLLQHLYRDLNKVKRFLTFKANTSNGKSAANRRRTKSTSSVSNNDDHVYKPTSLASSPVEKVPCSLSLYNSNVDRLLSKRTLVLQLLHLECTLLQYLRSLAKVAGFGEDVGRLLSAEPKFWVLQSRLEDLLRAHYMLLTKLSFEPTFLRVVSLVHLSTPANGARLLGIIFRCFVLKQEAAIKKNEDHSVLKVGRLEDEVQGEIDEELDMEMELKVEEEDLNENGNRLQATMKACGQRKTTVSVANGDSIANNRTLVLMLSFVETLAKEDLFAFSSSTSSNLNEPSVSLVAVCQEILEHFSRPTGGEDEESVTSGIKSLVRQRAIETLAHLCLTKNGLFDAIQRGWPLLQTLLSLVARCAHQHTRLVMRQSFLKASVQSLKTASGVESSSKKSSIVEATDSRQYIAVLRDIYGLLSILISLTEFKSGREHLLFHDVAGRLFSLFMAPFVEMLSGTETDDPRHLIESGGAPNIKEPGEAYGQLRAFFNANLKMQRYLDRIIGISSIIIQRLLEPMPIPLEEGQANPFTFVLPTESQQSSPQNLQNPHQILSDDENARDGTFFSALPPPTTSASPSLDLTDDSTAEKIGHFEAFDSDLDEDYHEEEDDDSEDDEEDSFTKRGDADSSTENIALVGKESLDFGRLSATLGQNAQASESSEDLETNTLRPYLRFFPELSGNHENASVEGILACSCASVDEAELVSRLLGRHQSFSSSLGRLSAPALPPKVPFNWRDTYERLSPLTASVMPRTGQLPLPELNFLQACGGPGRNEAPVPMTYPFLKRAPGLRKNYHHIKLVDHVRNRLSGPRLGRPIYGVVYDIEVEDGLNQSPNLQSKLHFDSKFECGNLRKVLVKENLPEAEGKLETEAQDEEYLLLLNTDVNSSTHTQWFYFSVSGMKLGRRYRFKIINLQKKSILYNSGQQPLLYSAKDFESSRRMWQRVGEGNLVAYYRNHYVRGSSVASLFADKPFYTLEFTYKCLNEGDLVYFSYNVPFSFTMLRTSIAYWQHLVEHEEQSEVFFRSQTLCCSLKGNDLPLMTITSSQNVTRKHYVLLSARVHPSESNSSWILKGFVDFLLHRSSDEALEGLRKRLLSCYVFKIIPMLNPDGVINGCTRTDLQRDDLNRTWHAPSPLLHPTIFHARNVLRCLSHFSGGGNPIAFVDLHGHSRRKNIFSYSCSPALSWRKSDRTSHKKRANAGHLCTCPLTKNGSCQLRGQMRRLKEMETANGGNNGSQLQSSPGFYLLPPFATLPVLLQLAQAPAFSLDSCSFAVQKDREHTARVVGWRAFSVPLSYTVECTASGCDNGPYAGFHLTVDQLEEMGGYIAASFGFLDFLHCSGRHVPLIVVPKVGGNSGSISQQQAILSPVRHPGNDDFLKNLLEKCTRKGYRGARSQAAEASRYQIRSLLQLYPDLNMLSASIATTSSSSSSTTSLSSAESLPMASPKKEVEKEGNSKN